MDGQSQPAHGPLGQVIRQYRQATFHRLVAPAPAVIRVLAGEKHVAWDRGELVARAGAMVLFPENLALTVENVPPEGGAYRAAVLPLPRAGIEAAYARLGPEGRRLAVPVACAEVPGQGADQSFDRLFAAGQGLPDPILALRQEELILWLAAAGAVLAPPAPQRLPDRLRGLLVAHPEAGWTAEQAARALAMSVPTLRRHLAAEATSFSALLQDVRMTHALALLQIGKLPVAAVAAAVGYDSPSRFAARFRARFGAAPRDIRHEAPQD